jgi:hypothetical protein
MEVEGWRLKVGGWRLDGDGRDLGLLYVKKNGG